MSSKFYVAGPGALWKGTVEVLDNGDWYWHEQWPERSRHPKIGTGILDRVNDYLRTQHWIQMLDEDLLMDEGL